jgi:hypothetical protein
MGAKDGAREQAHGRREATYTNGGLQVKAFAASIRELLGLGGGRVTA